VKTTWPAGPKPEFYDSTGAPFYLDSSQTNASGNKFFHTVTTD
jgi:hypothetical protein